MNAITAPFRDSINQKPLNKYGEKQVLIWRRSYDIRPGALEKDSPMWPGKDPRYADIPEADDSCLRVL